MAQKRNKIIVLVSSLFIALLTIFIIICYKSSSDFLIRQCEKYLNDVYNNKLRFTRNQAICKIIDHGFIKIVQALEEDDNVYPGDKIILSINLADILNGRFINIFTGEPIARPQDDIYTLCFIIYPNFEKKNSYSNLNTEYNLDRYYNWQFSPIQIIDLESKQASYICSKPLNIKEYSKVSLSYTIPTQDLLEKGFVKIRSYGTIIVFVPQNLSNIDTILKEMSFNPLVENNKNIIPIYAISKKIFVK